jgi:hypothetical protein
MKRIFAKIIIGLVLLIAMSVGFLFVEANFFPGSGNLKPPLTSTPSPQSILSAGRLAPLPIDASQVKTHAWHGPLTGESFLAFTAPRDSIASWLSQSTSLQKITGELSCRDNPCAPEWFPRGYVGINAELYEIPTNGHYAWLQVIIINPENTVYIYILWS